MTYLAGKAGRAAYANARKPPRRKAADPQSTVAGGPAALAAVAELMTGCTNCPAPACGAPKAEHWLPKGAPDDPGRRLYCTRQSGRRRCGCTKFDPVTDGGPDDARPD